MRVAVTEHGRPRALGRVADLAVIARRVDLAAALVDVLAREAEAALCAPIRAHGVDVEHDGARRVRVHRHVGCGEVSVFAELVFDVRAVGFAQGAAPARVVLEPEQLEEPPVAVEARDDGLGEGLAHAEVPAAALASVLGAVVDQEAGADAVVLPADGHRERRVFERIERVLDPPTDVTELERELRRVVEPDREPRRVVARRARVDAAHRAEQRTAAEAPLVGEARLHADVRPVIRVRAQELRRAAEPRVVAVVPGTDQVEREIELRAVRVVPVELAFGRSGARREREAAEQGRARDQRSPSFHLAAPCDRGTEGSASLPSGRTRAGPARS